ncbi:MAG: GGDEF domain-containing protein [Planctomycetota bacterium]|jgi:PleD family two-component response regulator
MVTSDKNDLQVLVVGDVGRAFTDAVALQQLPCDVYGNIPDAIDAAAKNRYVVVAVVMSGLSPQISTTLKTLRHVNSQTRILLLARMYEEPLAMQLVASVHDGVNLADDYLICPLRAVQFYESVTSVGRPQVIETVAPVAPDLVRRIRQLEKLATEDDLTGLKNRRYIWEFSRQIIERAKNEGRRVTLLLFDVDNLKSYNDVYGHAAGDEILKQAAVLVGRCCRQHDVIGRIGGDEFAVVFWDGPQAKPAGPESERRSPTAEHPKEAIFIAKRFQRELKKAQLPLLGPQGRGVLTISGALASFPRDGATIEQIYRRADRALLEAKRSGKNKIYLVGRPESDIADIE